MSQPEPSPSNAIELRVDRVSQLFQTLDPYPFREKDLDPDAEEFIVGWARELPRDSRLTIIIHMPRALCSPAVAADLKAAINGYFRNRAEVVGFDLKERFRVGRRSLAIGLTVLAVCIVASRAIGSLSPAPLYRTLAESLLILGWVANWKPLEFFLYDWWPIRRRRRLLERLAVADVELRAQEEPKPA